MKIDFPGDYSGRASRGFQNVLYSFRMIGLKLADGSFYPVLEEGVPKTKKLVLTTARNKQDTVHIVLVRGEAAPGGDLTFIRELFLKGLPPAPAGDPNIELALTLNPDMSLAARLSAPGLPEAWDYEAPRGTGGRVRSKRGKGPQDYRVTLKYWESSVPSGLTDEELAAEGVLIRPNAVSGTAFVLLGLFICAVLAFVFFELFRAPPQAPLGNLKPSGGAPPLTAFFFTCIPARGFFGRLAAGGRALFFAALAAFSVSCGGRLPEELPVPVPEILRMAREGDTDILRSADIASLDLSPFIRRQPGAAYYLACGLRDLGMDAEADILLRKTFQHDIDPWRREAGRELASRLNAYSGGGEALALALRYEKLYPGDFRSRLIMMKALLAAGVYDELLFRAGEFTASPPDALPLGAMAEALFFRARAEERAGHPRFTETVRRLFVSCPASAVHGEAWNALLEDSAESGKIFPPEELAFFKAKTLRAAGETSGILPIYESVSGRFAGDPVFLDEYAGLVQKVSGWREGIGKLSGLLLRQSGDARVIRDEYLGKFYRLAGDYAKSIAALRAALDGLGERENIFPASPGEETQRDRIIWYLLSSSLRMSSETAMASLPAYLPLIRDSGYFSDITESLASGLVRSRDWKSLAALYTLLREAGWEKESARCAFLLASAARTKLAAERLAGVPESRGLFEYALEHGETYYKILAGLTLKKDIPGGADSIEFFLPGSEGSPLNPGRDAEPASDDDKFVLGFLEFDLGLRAENAARRLRHSLAPETILRVAENSQAEGRYIDTLRLLQRAARRPGVVPGRRMLEALYPQAYFEEMAAVIADTKLPPDVFYGLVREESYFDAGIGSHAGAVGLAQLMPATAAEVAARLRISSPVLTDPLTNLRLGSFYLNAQWKRFGDGLGALAAYNAGTSRVGRWRKQNKDLPGVLFAESLSLSETREYVRKVLVAAVHYGYLYHNKTPRETVRDIYKDFP